MLFLKNKAINYFIILRGPAGIGKTTIAALLAKILNGYHICLDTILHEHNLDHISDTCIPEYNFLEANKIIIPLAQETLAAGKVVIFDGNFYHKKQLDDLIAQLQLPHMIYTIKASLETCLLRNKKRENRLSNQEVKNVFKLVSQFDYGDVINTEGQSIDKIIKKILRKKNLIKN